MEKTSVNNVLMEKEINLTRQQIVWLMSRGGRTAKDVHKDIKGRKFVLMYCPNTLTDTEKVYVPNRIGLSKYAMKRIEKREVDRILNNIAAETAM